MTSLTTDQEATFSINAAGDDDAPRPAGFSVTVSGYPGAFVARVGTNGIHFVPSTPGSYTATITGHSQDGTELPTVTLEFTVSAPPVPQATHFVVSDPAVKGKDITTPADPGTDTVTGNV